MARLITFGRHADTKPEGMLRSVRFPQLAKLDAGTNEGMINRILTSEGADSRSLPRTIYFQFEQAPGHFDSVAVGMIDEVTADGETGVLSGSGWIIDSDEGNKAAAYIATKSLFHNSVDLAEVKASYVEHGDWWDDDFTVDVIFDQWKFAATTFVGKPAFADAHGTFEEITAAFIDPDDELEVVASWTPELNVVLAETDEEITASAAGLPSWDLFHAPEATEPHPIRVGEPDENGFIPVFGHLALWNTCHEAYNSCVMPPRPTDNYASFNRSTVLTSRGHVETGPLSLKGGHVSLDKALDDVANAWADVRVTPGVHGPWMSGYVRPGTDEASVIAARASQVSGHWKGGRLMAVVSVNAPGFSIPGSGFSFTTNEAGYVDELVASFPGCTKPEAKPLPDLPVAARRFAEMSENERQGFVAYLQSLTTSSSNFSTHSEVRITTSSEESEAAAEDATTITDQADLDLAAALELELELENQP